MDLCRRECPFVIKPKVQRPPAAALPEGEDMETDMEGEQNDGDSAVPSPECHPRPLQCHRVPAVTDVAMEGSPGPSAEARPEPPSLPGTSAATTPSPRGGRCHPRGLGDSGDTAGGLTLSPVSPHQECSASLSAQLCSNPC